MPIPDQGSQGPCTKYPRSHRCWSVMGTVPSHRHKVPLTDGTALELHLEGTLSAQYITAKHTGSTTPSVPSSPLEVIRCIFPSTTPPLTSQVPADLENAWEEDLPRWWEIREPGCSCSSRTSLTACNLLMPFQMSAENKKGQTLPDAHGGAALASLGATPADISKELPHQPPISPQPTEKSHSNTSSSAEK